MTIEGLEGVPLEKQVEILNMAGSRVCDEANLFQDTLVKILKAETLDHAKNLARVALVYVDLMRKL